MKSEDKKGGIKGALKVYKMIYDMDKLVVILQFPAALFRAVKPYISLLATAYILDGFINGQSYEYLLFIALITVALNFAVDFLESYITKIQQVHNDVCIPKLYMLKESKNMTLDYQLLESPAVNEVRARVTRDNYWGSGFYNASFFLSELLNSFFGFIVGTAMIIPFFINNNISGGLLLLAAMLVFSGATSFLYSRVLQARLTEHLNNDDPKYDTKYQFYFIYGSSVSNILKTARIYGVKNLLSGYLEEDELRQNAFCKVYTRYTGASGLVGAVTSGVLTVGAYLFIVARAVTGAVSASNVVRYAGTIFNMVNSFYRLSAAATNLLWQTNRIQSMLEFMEIENVMYKGTLPIEKRRDNEYEIEFHNVSFKYPGCMGEQIGCRPEQESKIPTRDPKDSTSPGCMGEQIGCRPEQESKIPTRDPKDSTNPGLDSFALRNFSLKLNIGQKLAIVGMNGSGKTTMIKLLCRLYDPSEGVITLNGIDIKKYDYAEYMKIFSVVFQDFKIFSFKLSENIACSTDIDTERAAKATSMSGLNERAEMMRDGLDTYLYNDFDKGVEISGGEAQKVALARALYKNAPFIVLDEPTAALDPLAEFEIYSKFNDIVGDKTAIYISHRLSSCRFCDDIAVFHEGELIQRGSHETLLADAGGKYHELWNAQAQYYTV